ncbi:MAG: DUF2314 domain-containing protein [Verrucomicrobiales bacterium]
MVYLTAKWRVCSDEAAKDITQTTFAILARKATSLMSHSALGTWLHRNTVFEARKYLHAECRHLRKMKTLTDHQQEISSEQPWCRVGPIDEEWNDERLLAAPLRYFVGLNTGPNQMEIGEMIEDQDPKVYGEGPKPDVYLFTEWILNESVRGHKVTSIRSKDETMQAAMVKAQSMLPGVIERLVAGELEHFSVKVRVEDGEDVEYCWLSETQYADGIFSGILDAEAQTVGSVEVGLAHQVAADDVSDWIYTSAGLMHGNFTLRAMLPQMIPPERAKYSKLLADDAWVLRLIPLVAGALLELRVAMEIDSEITSSPQQRLHIVGCPRSGTTLMAELMAVCFRNDGFCEHEMSIFRPAPADAQLYFSKKPTDIRYVKKLLLGDPNLIVIGLYRDPRAVISSIHKSKQGMYFCNYLEWKSCQVAAEALQEHDRFLLVSYEELTATPDEVQARIVERYPLLEQTHDFTGYEKIANPSEKSKNALGGVRPIDTKRQQGWREHLPRVKAEIEKNPEFTQDLITWGYEKDDGWLQVLEGVESKEFPCRSAGGGFSLKKVETKIRKHFQTRVYLRRVRA